MGVIANICCKYFSRDIYGCKKQAKKFGLFEKECILVRHPHFKCLIQEEYPQPTPYKPYTASSKAE